MYGGLDTSTSNCPKKAGAGFRASSSNAVTRVEKPRSLIFCFATRSAAGDTSPSVTRAFGTASAMARPMQPEPVQRSSTRSGPSRSCKRSMVNSVTASVSSRGMSTSGVTVSVRPRKSHCPSKYASGQPARYRAVRSPSRASIASDAYSSWSASSAATVLPLAMASSSRAVCAASSPSVGRSLARVSRSSWPYCFTIGPPLRAPGERAPAPGCRPRASNRPAPAL